MFSVIIDSNQKNKNRQQSETFHFTISDLFCDLLLLYIFYLLYLAYYCFKFFYHSWYLFLPRYEKVFPTGLFLIILEKFPRRSFENFF